jgi:hypothetical protein
MGEGLGIEEVQALRPMTKDKPMIMKNVICLMMPEPKVFLLAFS